MTQRDPLTQNPLRQVLGTMYDKLSHEIAGGQRQNPEELLPGAQDPLEGLIPDSVAPQLETLDWFSPADFAGVGPGSEPRMDLSTIPAPGGKGVEGDGLDFFRTGEAPNNFTNRNNPLYVARKDFIEDVHGQIERMFNVSAGGVGYYRPPSSSDADPGGRSSNSDHYSAGAVDFYGDPEDLTALRNWLVDQPWVSFVRWQSESHFDHLHMSVDLGWVAQNYFTDRSIPDIKVTPPKLTPPSSGSNEQREAFERASGQRSPTTVRDRSSTTVSTPTPPQEIV